MTDVRINYWKLGHDCRRLSESALHQRRDAKELDGFVTSAVWTIGYDAPRKIMEDRLTVRTWSTHAATTFLGSGAVLKVVWKAGGSLSSLTPFPYPFPQSTTPLPLSWGKAELRAGGRGLSPLRPPPLLQALVRRRTTWQPSTAAFSPRQQMIGLRWIYIDTLSPGDSGTFIHSYPPSAVSDMTQTTTLSIHRPAHGISFITEVLKTSLLGGLCKFSLLIKGRRVGDSYS